MSTRLHLFAISAVVALAACSFDAVNFSLSPAPGDGPLAENCDTPGDEDGNGLADCSDPACAGAPACQVRCGNGKLEASEQCDDGNATNGDACENDCTLPRCGNGIIDVSLGEICDPPASGTCGPDCRSLLACGNGVIDPGEECDDGQANNGDDRDCRSDCVINRCGDGRANTKGTHHEDCDAGPRTADHIRTAVPTEAAGCNIDCTSPRCGDGKINGHFQPAGAAGTEQCDNGNANANNADCTATCQIGVCGDGRVNTIGPLHKEGCDDGNRNDSDSCNNACVAASCGDGIVGPGEECDLGAGNSDTGACLLNCRLAICGDGRLRAGVEECDGTAGPQPCSATCRQQRCGNGIIDPGEQCDDGNVADNDGCSKLCKREFCGDGIVNNGEPCDRALTPATCNFDCTISRCGDGKLNIFAVPPEQCDDGNTFPSDGCSTVCRFEFCGDGIKNAGEQCDDGNNVNGDGCENDCTLPVCGNGIIDSGELCDDGNALACGSCGADCLSMTSSPATGVIFPAPGAAYAGLDNFTLSDGFVNVTFQFTNGGPPALGRVAIPFITQDTTQTMASRIVNAVVANLAIGAQAVNGVVVLQNLRLTSRGNVAITEAVVPAGFAVFGMSGGKGGDCSANTGCVNDNDCASQICVAGRCL
jgi:cysteine-rich repeat protein